MSTRRHVLLLYGRKACVHDASFEIWKLEIVLEYLKSVCIVVDKFGYPRISNFWNIVSSYLVT